MNIPSSDARIEALLRQAAQAAVYPTTPDLRRLVAARLEQNTTAVYSRGNRWLAGAAALVAALVVLMAVVPQVRAGLEEWLRIGVVRIQLGGSQPEAADAPPATPPPDLVTWQELEGETTLDAAADAVAFTLMLPTYPRGMGKPDRVFVQELGAPASIILWLAEDGLSVDLALFQFGSGAVVQKVQPRTLREVTVRGRRGVWATGPYLVVLGSGSVEIRRLTGGEVLIWEEDGITYRLETRAGLEEALRIAVSLVPYAGR